MLKQDSLARLDTKVGSMKSRRRRSGLSVVISTAMMIAAMSILGSLMLTWANSNFNVQQTQIGNYYEQSNNALQETYVIEDVWFANSDPNHVYITTRNVGSIAIQLSSITINSFTLNLSPAVTLQKDSTYQATIPYTWNKQQTLDISVNTQRGSIERILWSVTTG